MRAEWIEVRNSLFPDFECPGDVFTCVRGCTQNLLPACVSLVLSRSVRPLIPDHLRALAQEWMKYHRSHRDAAPKLCVTREDDGEVGYGF